VSGFDLSALEAVFLAVERAGLDLILVGGHAVSFYAAKYRDRCPELAEYFPLRSKDADWIGTMTGCGSHPLCISRGAETLGKGACRACRRSRLSL